MEASSYNMNSIVTENYNFYLLPVVLAIVGGVIYYFTQKSIEEELNVNTKKLIFRALLATIFIFVSCLSSVYFSSKSIESLNDIPFLVGANAPF
jgi:cell division protein FtsW (lipid II flippase)